MNREILFKAKRIDNGKWVEGYYYKTYGCRNGNYHDDIIYEIINDKNN